MNFDVDIWLRSLTNISARYFILASLTFLIFYIFFTSVLERIKIRNKFPKTNIYY